MIKVTNPITYQKDGGFRSSVILSFFNALTKLSTYSQQDDYDWHFHRPLHIHGRSDIRF